MMLTLELDSDQHVIVAPICAVQHLICVRISRSGADRCKLCAPEFGARRGRVIIDSRLILIPPSPPPLAAAAPLFPPFKRTAYK